MNTNLSVGGISSSMINTANELSNYYDVSIYCFNPEGALREKISSNVRILDSSWRVKALCLTLKEAKKCGLKYLLFKVFSRCWSVVLNNRFPIYLAIKSQNYLGHYDMACSFTHEHEKHIEYTGLIRVLISKVNSRKKLTWVHCDYNHFRITNFNNKYYNKMDAIVGVTESVAEAFKKTHVGLNVPIDVCPNMLDYRKIYEYADVEQKIKYKSSKLVCFSACRLTEVKGIPRAIYAIKESLKKNDVCWYIAGDGPEKQKILELIQQYDLYDYIILLGETTNPFCYLKNADLYISVSYQEAAPLVYMEAKALHVPVFSTLTLSAKELLDKDIDFICDNNESSIAEVFDEITQNVSMVKNRKNMLKNYCGNNNKALDFYKRWTGE